MKIKFVEKSVTCQHLNTINSNVKIPLQSELAWFSPFTVKHLFSEAIVYFFELIFDILYHPRKLFCQPYACKLPLQ